MRQENRQKRREQIEQAAYELFEQKGYAGTSMLSVAKRAKASNETLYRWYGDKLGLFLSLIERNTLDVKAVLEADMPRSVAPRDVLKALGPKLLGLLVSERAIALNRAAAADTSGELGKALAKGGRETVLPMIEAVFQRLIAEIGPVGIPSAEAAELYISLLIGDVQVRRLIGVIAPLNDGEITRRSDRAYRMTLKLLGQ